MRLRTWLAVVAVLASCSSLVAPRAHGPAENEYFPMVAGTHWVYQVRTGPSTTSTLEVTARGLAAVPGVAEQLFIMEERGSDALFGVAADGVVGYASDGEYVRRATALARDASGALRALGSGMAPVLPLHPHPGQRWRGDVDLFFAEDPPLVQRWTYAVEGVGRIDVPAGSFSDVILVRSWLWDASEPGKDPLVHYEDYYARGVGLIRSVSRNHGDPVESALSQELMAVHFAETAGDR